MARKRMLDPSIWADEDFSRLSDRGKIFFIGLISNADDDGILPGNPQYLASVIFPFTGLSPDEALLLRNEVILTIKSILIYRVSGKDYILLTTWDKYQYIQRPIDTKYPTPNEGDDIPHGILREQSMLIEKKIIERKGSVKGNQFKNSFEEGGGSESQTVPEAGVVDREAAVSDVGRELKQKIRTMKETEGEI